MSNSKTINTRVMQKYDLYSNWSTNNPVLLKGEIAIAYIPTDTSTTANGHTVDGTTPPNILIKVGDGTSNYNDLKFVSALSADVNTYAKYTNTEFESVIKTLARAEVSNDIQANSDAIEALETLVGSTSVNTQIASYIESLALADTYATKEQAQSYADAKDAAIAEAKKAGTDAQTAVDSLSETVNAIETTVGTVSDLTTTAKTDIVSAINEVRESISGVDTSAAITIDTSSTTTGALKSYTIKQGATTIGVIDIPKDMVVESGVVVTNPDGYDDGTYIKLVLANVADPLYINVGTLVDIYVAKANATQIQVSIDSSTREISATIVAGSIGTAELADSAVTSVKIADANVTLAKLATSVQASLSKADSAIQSIATGTSNGTISVDGNDVIVKGLGSAAYTDASAYDKAGAANSVATDLSKYEELNNTRVSALENRIGSSGDTLILDCGGSTIS